MKADTDLNTYVTSIIFLKCLLFIAISGSVSAGGIPGLYITLMVMVEILSL